MGLFDVNRLVYSHVILIFRSEQLTCTIALMVSFVVIQDKVNYHTCVFLRMEEIIFCAINFGFLV